MKDVLLIENSKGFTKCITKDGDKDIEKDILKFLDEECIKHGSTYKGRVDAAKSILEIRQKVPVLISEVTQILFFPIVSAKHKDNVWIQYNAIVSTKSVDHSTTQINFNNGLSYEVLANQRVIKSQMKRCKEYLDYLQGNKA